MIYKLLAILILLVFYGIYFTKMILQKRQGIRTHQIGTRKEKSISRVERIMSFATLGIVIVQLLSIVLDWNHLPPSARWVGFAIGMIGNMIFLISITTMRDSWRAGIPESDKTEFVSSGIYGISRNPAFLGFDLMYIGMLLLFFNIALLAFTLLAIISLHLQILQEEKFLEGRFGEVYIQYRQQVNRYIGKRN